MILSLQVLVPRRETHIVVDPVNSDILVATISDFSLRGGYNTTKYSVSFKNGKKDSWRDNFVPLYNNFPVTSDGTTWDANSDPVLAMDREENVYLSSLYFNTTNNMNGLYVAVSAVCTDSRRCRDELEFEKRHVYPVSVNLNPNTTIFEDKDWIAADSNKKSPHKGNVYVSWTRFIGDTSNMILFSRSTDEAKHWSNPIQISLNSQNGAVQGSQIAIGPEGEIYVAYEVFLTGNHVRHYLVKSTNGGRSFSTPQPITPIFNDVTFLSTYRKNSFPI